MNLSTNKNVNGELVDLDQACSITNLGRNTVRNLASSAGAIRKIGRCSRIRKDILLNYIEENCKAEQQKGSTYKIAWQEKGSFNQNHLKQ